MSTVFAFDHTPIPTISQVGGKAYSLIRMTEAGLNVPDGFACAADFFEDWTQAIEASAPWAKLQAAFDSGADHGDHIAAIKDLITELEFSPAMTGEIDGALSELKQGTLYAVRSSSPEEDLEGSSFAGMYETILGVERNDIADALRQVFASAYDERVFAYKTAKGFSLRSVRIAAIVMQQIASETAGVGFSVNPINNDFDEAAINANYGLGESVVSGIVTPDYFVVDKVTGAITSKTLGNKARSIFLGDGPSGRTREQTNENRAEFSISDDQARAIAEMIVGVEKLYGVPMDIEWAYGDDQLYLLQARPITTFIPLPPDMQTEPGAKKRTLYYDVSVLEGITTNRPITTITQDWMLGPLARGMTAPFLGQMTFSADGDPKTEMFFGKGVRAYMNFSQMFFLASPKTIGEAFREGDDNAGQALIHIDKDMYLPDQKFPYLEWRTIVPFALRRVFASHHAISTWIKEIVNPIRFKERDYLPRAKEAQKALAELGAFDGPIEVYADKSGAILGDYFEVLLPVIMTYSKHLAAIPAMFEGHPVEIRELGDHLTMGIDGDEAVNLGIALFELAHLLPASDFDDIDALVAKCQARDLPSAFMTAWDQFVAVHGMRGPNEMEIANPRYGDDPALAFGQMATMRDVSASPADALKKHVQDRKAAYKTLMQTLPPKEAKTLRKHYEVVEALAPLRDTMKYYLVQIGAKVRALALRDGAALHAADRVDDAQDIFFLTFAEIAAGLSDKSSDLRSLVGKRKPEFEHATANVRAFPVLIDSRGRIPAPPAKARADGEEVDPNVLHGAGISRGVARGRVKVLKDPREKTIEKGDILVTYNTDPGWTPLFIRAEGIILEIGGVLQHGGVVAREYGKPCVASISGVTEKLRDGQMVEVDGTDGTVTILD